MNLNLQTNDSTALHMAAEGGYTEVVNALLEAGANPKEENGVRCLTQAFSFFCV